MKFTIGLILGMLTGLAIWRAPSLTAGLWTSIPPETPLDYTGPRMRQWSDGVEVISYTILGDENAPPKN